MSVSSASFLYRFSILPALGLVPDTRKLARNDVKDSSHYSSHFHPPQAWDEFDIVGQMQPSAT
jgi:hypothetical protein